MNSKDINNSKARIALYLVVFIDGMGLGLIFPILNTIFLNSNYHFFHNMLSTHTKNIEYGIAVGAYMFSWLFGAPLLSDLSDQLGRKKTLLIALWGTLIGYILTGLGIIFHSVLWIVVGRLIDGFTAGSQPIAQAAIVDIGAENKKAKNIGRVLLWLSLGFVLGPIIGGLLTRSDWVSWFSLQTPVFAASALALVNIILLYILFNETHTVSRIKISLLRPLQLLVKAFREGKIARISIVFLLAQLGWSLFYSYSSAYAVKDFSFSTLQVMLYMSLMGLGFVLGFGFLVGFFEKRQAHHKTLLIVYTISALAMILFFVYKQEWLIWVMVIPATAFNNTGYSTFLAMYSDAVDKSQQGWVMGASMAITAFSFAVTGFFGGAMLLVKSYFPVLIAVILTIVALVFLYSFCKQQRAPFVE